MQVLGMNGPRSNNDCFVKHHSNAYNCDVYMYLDKTDCCPKHHNSVFIYDFVLRHKNVFISEICK